MERGGFGDSVTGALWSTQPRLLLRGGGEGGLGGKV